MSMETKVEMQKALAQAGETGDALRSRVRALVTQAVLERRADPGALRQVVEDAIAGIGEGLGRRGEIAGDALKAALQGLDEAMAKSVYALKLALEEAWSNGHRFASEDLRQVAEAVRHLEDDLVHTLRQTAERTQGEAREELTRLAEHLRVTGTDTGARVREVAELLQMRFSAAADGAPADVKSAAQNAGARLAEVASGILRGLADALDARRG